MIRIRVHQPDFSLNRQEFSCVRLPTQGIVYYTKNILDNSKVKVKKSRGIPVTGRGGPQGCEMLRLPHFLDNRLTNGGTVVILTRRPPFIPKNTPGTHFC
jgi:hypothetical protein